MATCPSERLKEAVEIFGSDAVVAFPQRVSAVAAGQACVIYDKQDGHLIGGAFIPQG